MQIRGVIDIKASKTAGLTKFSDILTLSPSSGGEGT
jgi:hypothetical protein